ncbi:MAG: type ISP restriction/modification enzyme [Chloroflexota bacterium]|nr:type ISP restriction/modification enzyme [Chloroflexota bacterium]
MVAKIYYADLWGSREGKYQKVAETDITSTDWSELEPHSPFYFFVPRDEELLSEYENGWKVTEIFPTNSVGIVTSRDHFVLDFDEALLKERINNFRENFLSDDEVRERNGLKDKDGWSVADARKAIRQDKEYKKAFTRCLYRPFDIRPILYHDAVIERSRPEVMRHMLAGENLGLIAMRQVALNEPYSHFGVTQFIVDNRAFYSNKGIQYLFPLYLYPAKEKEQPDKSGGKEGGIQSAMQMQTKREPNLKPEFIKAFSEKLGLKFIEDGKGNFEEIFGPEDVFNYAYAVFHSPTYRSRYVELLKIDFPRLPLTSNRELFKALVAKGAELVSLHLMESPKLDSLITKYPILGPNQVETVRYDEANQRVYINKSQYFEGVPPEVWNFHIGGYQVCQKWLKDRKGRSLSYDELTQYQKIIVALKETIRLMREIDELIHGWSLE